MPTTGDKKELKHDAVAQIRSVERILRTWDPIGVLSVPGGPEDEYDSYAPRIVTLVNSGCNRAGLTDHLEKLRVGSMGVGADRPRDEAIADEILRELRSTRIVAGGQVRE